MSNDTLRELLHDLGGDHPPISIDPATYRRGRRAHRRRVLAGGIAGALGVVAALTVSLPALDRPTDPLPATDLAAPALPSRLYAVPGRLAEHRDGRYVWHPDLAVESLAIGTTAAVFPVNRGAVVAVSAVDGRYRGLDLPGFDPAAYFRFGGPPVALSPDGTRLAYTWNPRVISDKTNDGYLPSGVRIVDLRTGSITNMRIEGGFGVFAHSFSWSPNGRYLAYDLHITTNGTGGVQGYENFTVGRLDTKTGTALRATGLSSTDSGPAVSDRGEVATVGNRSPRTWLPGRRPQVQRFHGQGDDWTAAWSPDANRLAAGSHDRGWFSVGRPDRGGLMTGTAADAPPGSGVRVLGWADSREVALLHHTRDDTVISLVPTSRPRGGAGRTLVEVAIGQGEGVLSVATGLLARPTRDFPEPDWPTAWARVGGWTAGVALALALALLWLHGYRRTRRLASVQAADA